MIAQAKIPLYQRNMAKLSDLVKKVKVSLLNLLGRFFQKNCKGSHLNNYYTHAKDIPFYNWAQLHDYEPNNIELLKKVESKTCTHCAKLAYDSINKSLIDVYGYSDEYKNKVQIKAKIRLKELDYWITGDRFANTEANILKAQYAELLKDKENDSKVWDTFYNLENSISFKLDPKTETLLSIYARTHKAVKDFEQNQKRKEEIDKRAKAVI